jgi:hypothetical protein
MTQATINGNTYSDDGTSSKDMLNGGHRTHFIPMVGDVATVAGVVATQAAQTAIDAANAANSALATKGTSTTSLAVSAGSKSITTQSGKQFTAGNFITISRTSAPTTLMHGVVTAYSGTALTVEVSTISGSGTYTDWTIALSGAQGVQGPSGNGVLPYSAKTGAYTVVTTDRGSLIDCTSGTFTLAFQACATLGADWSCYIRNSGAGVVTLDPNGAETIDGAATYTLNPGSVAMVQCDGTVLRVASDTPQKLVRLPIFSADAVSASAVSVLEKVENQLIASGLTVACTRICFGNSLFLADGAFASQANIATSPDGVTWTLRAMPSTSSWAIATNGSNQFIGTVHAGTTTAKSTDGITWSAGAALPGVNKSTQGAPVFNGSLCLVLSNTASTAYTSSDNATTWGAQTLPAAANTAPFVVGGLFWYFSSATTAYTSATGATGTWTSRALPVTPDGVLYQDFDGALWIAANTGSVFYRSTDGINWVLQAITPIYATVNGTAVRTVNGVYCYLNPTFGNTKTWHSGRWVARSSSVQDTSNSYAKCAKNTAGTVFLFPHNTGTTGQVGRIAPAESTAATALFTK